MGKKKAQSQFNTIRIEIRWLVTWDFLSLLVNHECVGEVGDVCEKRVVVFIGAVSMEGGVRFDDLIDFILNDCKEDHHVAVGDTLRSRELLRDLLIAFNRIEKRFNPICQTVDQALRVVSLELILFFLVLRAGHRLFEFFNATTELQIGCTTTFVVIEFFLREWNSIRYSYWN